MHRLLLCLLALSISVATSAQTSKKKYKKHDTEKTDSAATAKDSSANSVVQQKPDSTPKVDSSKLSKKKDYKKANETAKEKYKGESPSTLKKKPTNTNTVTKPAPKQKPMTAAEKKKADQEEAERQAALPKGIESYYYVFPKEFLPVVMEFMAVKQAESPHLKVRDDNTMRSEIIRFKDIDKGYIELQKPGDTKYTRMQVFKKPNGSLVMAVEQSDCQNGFCKGTLNFYSNDKGGPAANTSTAKKETPAKKDGATKPDATQKTASPDKTATPDKVGSWKDVTDEYFPEVDNKFVLSRLKSKYKKEYKDLELYNNKAYEDNEANLKKAITYTIAPQDAKIVISEQYLPCLLYEMIWDGKKGKFDLKKNEK